MSLDANALSDSANPRPDALPRALGDGLVLRYARAEDADAIAQLNGRVFGQDQFNYKTAVWVRDFCSEKHPSCGPSNVTLVEDTRAGKFVSSMCLIPQTWTFAGIPFGVGRMEAVCTDPDYRRRGLMRAQFEVMHARSAAMGHLVQSITGIPWYYRQFGYEYALELAGARILPFVNIPALKEGEAERYRIRPMTVDDIPFAMPLFDKHAEQYLVTCPRPEWLWRHLLTGITHLSSEERSFQMIETPEGRPVGYVAPAYEIGREMYIITEAAVAPGESLRTVMSSILRQLRVVAETRAVEVSKTVNAFFFQLGASHPLYDALREYWTRTRPPYAWYIRVPDTAALMCRFTPVFEKRLANSAMAGYTGEFKINEYKTVLCMNWQAGKLVEVKEEPVTGLTEWPPAFPPRTFLKLLFSYRSLAEVEAAFPDCFSWGETELMLDILFPKLLSFVIPVG